VNEPNRIDGIDGHVPVRVHDLIYNQKKVGAERSLVAHPPWAQKKFLQHVYLTPWFLLFSTIWGICSSFKVNPNGLKTIDTDTVGARPAHLLFKKPSTVCFTWISLHDDVDHVSIPGEPTLAVADKFTRLSAIIEAFLTVSIEAKLLLSCRNQPETNTTPRRNCPGTQGSPNRCSSTWDFRRRWAG
jgi:hypothetical protein